MSEALLQRTCMRDRIRNVLVTRILDGSYPPGMQLKELALAHELKVSQAPIREALRELEASGLVTSERYRGTRVRTTDLQDMREAYEVRELLEVRAVEAASPFAQEALTDLSACLAGMAAAIEAGDTDRYIDQALALHRRLVEASGNRTFLRVWDSLHWDIRGRIALRHFAQHGGDPAQMVSLHRKLLTALAAQDTAAAIQAIRVIFTRFAAIFATPASP